MKKIRDFYLPNEDTYFAPYYQKDNGFQVDHLDVILKYVTCFDVAVDGGAHVGSWSVKMAQHFKTVHAFEPATDTYLCLSHNIQAHKNINAYHIALGEEYQKIDMVDDDKRIGNTGARYIKPGEQIDMQSLDSLRLKDVGLIKLDVEGYEYYALRGAVQTILKYKPVVVIEKKSFKDRFEKNEKHADEYLWRLGMKAVDIVGNDVIYKF
jgi:FkbM family methyltransferase